MTGAGQLPPEIEALLRRIVPPVAAIVLLVTFVSLGLWQLDRAAQKEALNELFEGDIPHQTLVPGMPFVRFSPIRTQGTWLTDRQFLIDNMIVGGRPGYFVLTPLEWSPGAPLLIVNRGWIARVPDTEPDIRIPDAVASLEGRMGRLPRVGIRQGPAFPGAQGWPRKGVFPTLEDIAAELGREVMPYAILLDPDPESGLARQWKPRESGPMKHYGYALQWFAMAAAVIGVAAWRIRKFLARRNAAR